MLPGLLKAVLAIQYSPVEKFKVHRCVTYAHTLLLAFCFKRASSGSTAQSLYFRRLCLWDCFETCVCRTDVLLSETEGKGINVQG